MIRRTLTLSCLLTSSALAGENWQRMEITQSHDIWHMDVSSIVRSQNTGTIRIRVSLFDDPSINSVVYTEQFDCRYPISKTLSIQFTLDGTKTDLDQAATEHGTYFVPSAWKVARDIVCKLPSP
jgi:hypothetical protein